MLEFCVRFRLRILPAILIGKRGPMSTCPGPGRRIVRGQWGLRFLRRPAGNWQGFCTPCASASSGRRIPLLRAFRRAELRLDAWSAFSVAGKSDNIHVITFKIGAKLLDAIVVVAVVEIKSDNIRVIIFVFW